MISAGEFRNGVTMEFEGDPYVVLEFQHVKPGKGAAFVRTKIKNLKTGAVLEKTFRPTEKMPRAHIDRQDMQYLYSDGDLFHFMNAETFDQIAVNSADVGDSLKFVKENEVVKILAYDGQVFGIEPPLRGTGNHGNRTRLCRQYRTGRNKACHRGNRRADSGTSVHQPG